MEKSPICDEYINNSSDINSYQDLYDSSLKRINKTIVSNGARMAGWEDVLLIHSEKSQSEIDINKNLLDLILFQVYGTIHWEKDVKT